MEFPIRLKRSLASRYPQEVGESRITIFTHLIGGQNARQVQILASDSNYIFFQKCAAAWPDIFEGMEGIHRLVSSQEKHWIEICKGHEGDLRYLTEAAKREQEAGKKTKVYLLKDGDSTAMIA